MHPPSKWPVVLLIATAGSVLAACGGNDADNTSISSPGDLGRYCALVQQLNVAGTEFFSALGPDPSDKEFEQAQAEFVQQHADELNAVVEVAPVDIRPHVATVIGSQKATAGLGPEIDQSKVLQAESHVGPYNAEHCAPSPTQG